MQRQAERHGAHVNTPPAVNAERLGAHVYTERLGAHVNPPPAVKNPAIANAAASTKGHLRRRTAPRRVTVFWGT